MAEIRSFGLLRHLRADASAHVLHFSRGRLVAGGRGLSFWFLPLTTSVAEVPVDDRDQPLLFHGRSADFQDVTAQGVVTYRVADPAALAARVDFTIDLLSGLWRRTPVEAVAALLAQRAERHAWGYIASHPVRAVLAEGQARIREAVEAGLSGDAELSAMGLALVAVDIGSVRPSPDVEKALEAPTRERIQQEADEAAFARRALAVEKERAIQENELQNRIELARREEQLILQKGQNARQEATEQAEAERIAAEAEAQRERLSADARANTVRVEEGARVEMETRRMAVYQEVPPPVLMGLAARSLASKLRRIEHLNVGGDLLGSLLTDLAEAGARRLRGPEGA